MDLTTKQIREQREFETLFKNPKHARSTWAQSVIDRYCKPAIEPIRIYDKEGNFYALYRYSQKDNYYKCEKMFA